jgi:Protein of unknown function (DUF2924)
MVRIHLPQRRVSCEPVSGCLFAPEPSSANPGLGRPSLLTGRTAFGPQSRSDHQGLADQLQHHARGGPSRALQRRLRILAGEFEKGARSFDPGRVLKTGATLVRQWRGRTHTVLVREYCDLGAIKVKGIAGEVSAWQVLRPSVVASRFEALRGSALSPLVGRDRAATARRRRRSPPMAVLPAKPISPPPRRAASTMSPFTRSAA